MRAHHLWIICIVSLAFVAERFIPVFLRNKFELGIVGLVISAVLAIVGLRTQQDRPQYKWILALSLGTLVLIGVFLIWLFLMMGFA